MFTYLQQGFRMDLYQLLNLSPLALWNSPKWILPWLLEWRLHSLSLKKLRNINLIILVSVSHHHHLWVLIFLSSSKVTAIIFNNTIPASKGGRMVTSKQTRLSSIIKDTRFLHRPWSTQQKWGTCCWEQIWCIQHTSPVYKPWESQTSTREEKGGFFKFLFLQSHLISDGAISFNIHKHPSFHFAALLFLIVFVCFFCNCVIGSSGLQAVVCVFAFPLIW